ncbi:MAG: hypothetical protein R3E91_02375 [Chlamydiales bacterium]
MSLTISKKKLVGFQEAAFSMRNTHNGLGVVSVEKREELRSSSSKCNTFGFAILIIVGIGGLIVAGVGVSHCFGAISTLHQVHATIMMAIGGGSSFILTMIALVMKVRNRGNSLKRDEECTKHSPAEKLPVPLEVPRTEEAYKEPVQQELLVKKKEEQIRRPGSSVKKPGYERKFLHQSTYHNMAKSLLIQELQKIGTEVIFASGNISENKSYNAVIEYSTSPLDAKVFSWKYMNIDELNLEIEKDSKIRDRITFYGVPSLFNGKMPSMPSLLPTESRNLISNNLFEVQARLQFPDEQLEIIDRSAHIGFNGMVELLNQEMENYVWDGRLAPETFEQARLVIRQLKDQNHPIEYLCVGNVPKGTRNGEKIYKILIGTPIFTALSVENSKITSQQKKEIAYLCAVRGYSAQFEQAIKFAQTNRSAGKKTIIVNATTPSFGVFSNDPQMVAKGFYVAGKAYEADLKSSKILVQWRVPKDNIELQKIAGSLGLKKTS